MNDSPQETEPQNTDTQKHTHNRMSQQQQQSVHHRRRSSLSLDNVDFTDSDMEEFAKDFARYDEDRDGILNKREYNRAAHDLNLQYMKFEYFDCDGSGGIDFDEFVEMIFTNLKLSHMQQKFVSMDENGDGCLSREELRNGLVDHGVTSELDDDAFDRLFSVADVDGNNELDIEEFLHMVSHGIHKKILKLR